MKKERKKMNNWKMSKILQKEWKKLLKSFK